MSREENGMIFIIGNSRQAGDGGLAVNLHDDVYIDTECYCDRNICTKNEYNGIECDECEVTKSNEGKGDVMLYLDAKEAVAEMRKHGFDIVRCEDCKRSRTYGDRTYCNRLEGYVSDNGFCSHGIHIEKVKCYECPIAEQYNLEDDDTPCLNCGEDDNADETL